MKTKVEKFPPTKAEKDSPLTGAIPGSAYEGPHGIVYRVRAEMAALEAEAERKRAAALVEGADVSDGQ